MTKTKISVFALGKNANAAFNFRGNHNDKLNSYPLAADPPRVATPASASALETA